MHRILAFLALGLTGCSSNESHESSGNAVGAQLIKIAAGNEPQWSSAVLAAKAPPFPFAVNLEFVTDPKFQAKSVDEALALLPQGYPYDLVFLADERTLLEADHPCIVVDLSDEKRSRFRATAKCLASIENNLGLANMDFSEFEEAAKATGIFRGF